MQALERNIVSNGRGTVLREKISGALDTLALLKNQLEGLEDGKQIVASLQKIRRDVLKTDPTLIWQEPRLTRQRPSQTRREPSLAWHGSMTEVEVKEEMTAPTQVLVEKPQRKESGEGLPAKDTSPVPEEIPVQEQQPENLEGDFVDMTLGDDSKPEISSAQGREESVDIDDIDDEEEIKDLSTFGLYLKEIGKVPIQKAKHTRWGEEVFAGEIGLKALNQLVQSELLSQSQKEQVLETLRKGKFLFERINSRIARVQKRLEVDKYENKQARELDRELIETVFANEYLVSVILPESLIGIEVEEEKNLMVNQFIDKRISFINQGLESWENLVNGSLRLVVSIARRYQNRGIDLPDLVGYGEEGLIIAAADYDPRKGYQFSTYATSWIKQKITRALADYGSMIRLPTHVHQEIRRGRKAQEQDLDKDGRPSENLPDKLRSILHTQIVSSLDEPIDEDGERTLSDTITDQNQNLEEVGVDSELRDKIMEVLATLPDRESRVLDLRFGLSDGKQRTLEEVGREFGVTRERIRQIEAKALIKLRHPSRKVKLQPFL